MALAKLLRYAFFQNNDPLYPNYIYLGLNYGAYVHAHPSREFG